MVSFGGQVAGHLPDDLNVDWIVTYADPHPWILLGLGL
jgi:hypothetical protein